MRQKVVEIQYGVLRKDLNQLKYKLDFLLQKEMFAAKVDGVNNGSAGPPPIGGSYNSGRNQAAAQSRDAQAAQVSVLEPPGEHERKLSQGSGGGNSQIGMKSKWMKAFKGIKGAKEDER